MMNKFLLIIFFFFFSMIYNHAQSNDYLSVKPKQIELGLGSQFAISTSAILINAFLRNGKSKPKHGDFGTQIILSPHFQINDSHNFEVFSISKYGKLVAADTIISESLSDIFYIWRLKTSPVLALDFNCNQTNEYGFPVEFIRSSGEHTSNSLPINAGPPIRKGNVVKVIPIIGGIVIVFLLLKHIASQSR